MKILIIAATEYEIGPFLKSALHQAPQVDVLITGAGMVATSYALAKRINNTNYDLFLNVGIAGAFHKETALGTIFRVSDDLFSELGAEDGAHFLSLKEMGFGEVQFQERLPRDATVSLEKLLQHLPKARGITVNTVHGNESSIQSIQDQFSPDLESMEGAAVFYVASQEGIPALQIRSISNLVEKRNKENWNIPLAINTLNLWLIQFITDFLKTNPS